MDIDEEPPYTEADPSHSMPEDNPIPSPRPSQRAYVEDVFIYQKGRVSEGTKASSSTCLEHQQG